MYNLLYCRERESGYLLPGCSRKAKLIIDAACDVVQDNELLSVHPVCPILSTQWTCQCVRLLRKIRTSTATRAKTHLLAMPRCQGPKDSPGLAAASAVEAVGMSLNSLHCSYLRGVPTRRSCLRTFGRVVSVQTYNILQQERSVHPPSYRGDLHPHQELTRLGFARRNLDRNYNTLACEASVSPQLSDSVAHSDLPFSSTSPIRASWSGDWAHHKPICIHIVSGRPH